jgi:pimeloyl-ACP methyl ester carboxylesterase
VEAQSGFQRVNGLRLYVHRFRDASVLPSGLTLLLLHGYQDAGATWDLVAEHLVRAGHDVIAPDLRGFGQSDAVGGGGYYHFPDYVADVAELVDAVAPRRLGVVGHSMGGTIAALYAGALPHRVERLALLEGLGPLATEPSFAVDRMRAWLSDLRREKPGPRTLSSMTEAIERLVYKHPAVPRDVLAARAKLLTRADHAGQLAWAYDGLHRTTSPTPFSLESFKAFLRLATMPVLVVSGGKTGWHPFDEADRMACLPNARAVEIADAGHMMHWTAPEKLARALGDFFAEPTPSPKPPIAGAATPEAPASSHRKP